jgi:large subunit ribosomal protein L3
MSVNGLIGRKVGMTQVFREDGSIIPVTVIEAGPCIVTQIKTKENDGYDAVQMGFEETKGLSKPEANHLANAKAPQLRHLREFSINAGDQIQLGQKIDVSIFKAGEQVDVIGISRGLGFAGVVKRHHFAGGPKTHGASDRTRAPGSIGSTTTPGRVLKGLRMAGHMGDDRVTQRNLEIVSADPALGALLVRGAVPGAKNAILVINSAQHPHRKHVPQASRAEAAAKTAPRAVAPARVGAQARGGAAAAPAAPASTAAKPPAKS